MASSKRSHSMQVGRSTWNVAYIYLSAFTLTVNCTILGQLTLIPNGGTLFFNKRDKHPVHPSR